MRTTIVTMSTCQTSNRPIGRLALCVAHGSRQAAEWSVVNCGVSSSSTSRRGSKRPPIDRRLVGVAAVVYAGVLGLIVLWPGGEVASGSVSRLHAWAQALGAPTEVTAERIEFAANVLVFVPLSLLGSLLKPQWTWSSWVVAGYCVTFAIEATQAVFSAGNGWRP
jgi:hypothetical protein